MEVKPIEFQYKGARDYIQGPDMFNAMIDALGHAATLSRICFTIHDFVRTTICQMYLTGSKDSLNEVKDIAARCQLDIDGITHWVAIVPDDKENDAHARYAYDEGKVVSLCEIEEEGIKLNNLSPYSFIETVVAMNKHMHQKLFQAAVGQWIFTRVDLPELCDKREKLKLNLRHNMNYRLTRSNIEVDGKKVGDIFFSLVNT